MYVPSIPVGTQVNFGLVHVVPFCVPRLKSLTIVAVPPGGVTLNWKASGPLAGSVAVAVNVMVLPIGSGDAGDEFKAVTVTAKAGADIAMSNAIRNDRVLVDGFMESFPRLEQY